ncbi:MAG: AraC family transcriptional regulator [Desulfovibrio sp.]|jgi:AraC-like DNA-binding protein|nr:AraC family transcriptional regulator [Desulfovibrio sp.]
MERNGNLIRYGSAVRVTMEPEGGGRNNPRAERCSIELPEDFSPLRFHLEYLGRGVSLAWCDSSLPEDAAHLYRVEKPALSFSTFLSGYMEYALSSRVGRKTSDRGVHPGDSVFTCRECEGLSRFYAGTPYRFATVVLSPAAFERMIEENGMSSLPGSLQKIEKGVRPHNMSPLTKLTQRVASQIIACPATEVCRSLFLEGKALELLSLHFNMLLKNDKRASLTKSDVDRIHAARDILVGSMYDPPGIQKLSALCGLNEFKLKRGFRACFGDTVHGLLVRERMQHALALLRDSDTSVNIVANAVGYSSIGNFIKAFRNQFGITPGQILKNARRGNHQENAEPRPSHAKPRSDGFER